MSLRNYHLPLRHGRKVADRTRVANRHTKENRPSRSLPRTACHRGTAAGLMKRRPLSMALNRAFVRFQVATPGHNNVVTRDSLFPRLYKSTSGLEWAAVCLIKKFDYWLPSTTMPVMQYDRTTSLNGSREPYAPLGPEGQGCLEVRGRARR